MKCGVASLNRITYSHLPIRRVRCWSIQETDMRVLLLPTLLMCSTATAQTAPATSGGPPDILNISPPPTSEHKLSFSFGEGVGRGDPLCIPVNIGGKEHLFVVDTGFPGTAVDLALARGNPEIFGPETKSVTVTAMQGARAGLAVFKAPPLHAGGERLHTSNSEIAAFDMAMIREAAGRPIEGILGMDVLHSYVVGINFERRVFELADPRGFRAPDDPKTTSVAIREVRKGAPGIVIPIAGVADVAVTIDTGGDMAVALTHAMLQKMTGGAPTTRPSWVIDAAGNATAVDYLLPQKWSLAGTDYQNLWVEETAFDCLGLCALANYVVTLDFPQQRAYFRPLRASHPAQRPRLEFGIGAKEGGYEVKFAGDAAAKLDIKAGDKIVAVDGKAVEQMEIWRLREELREAGSAVITFRRDGQEQQVTLRHD
jgi:hypothetical protein